MKNHFHYKCLRKTTVAFLNLFNDIKIGKYQGGTLAKLVDVPIKFAPKQKFYYWVYDRKHEKRLPMLAAEITSISYSADRAKGKNEKIRISSDQDKIDYYVTPTPYDINFTLKAATEYMTEMNQIAEQILPFFNPFVYTTVNVPEINDTFNMKVMFNSVTLDQESDIGQDEYRNIIWSFDFTVKAWILKPSGDIGTVRKVIQKIYTDEEAWNKHSVDTQQISGGTYDDIEYLTIGSLDPSGNELIKFEVFE